MEYLVTLHRIALSAARVLILNKTERLPVKTAGDSRDTQGYKPFDKYDLRDNHDRETKRGPL